MLSTEKENYLMKRGFILSVFGGSRLKYGGSLYHEAQKAGLCLAKLGIQIYSGGYSGIMEAISRGAAEGGGRPVGVTCSIFGDTPPNRYVYREIKCPTIYSRLEKLIETADAYLIFPGATGTMAEIMVTFEVSSKFAHSRPIIFWKDYWKSIVHQVESLITIGDSRIPLKKNKYPSSLPISFVQNITELKTIIQRNMEGSVQ